MSSKEDMSNSTWSGKGKVGFVKANGIKISISAYFVKSE